MTEDTTEGLGDEGFLGKKRGGAFA